MTQITLNVEDKAILPHLKKILSAINGVSIAKPVRKKKPGIEEALEDIKANRITHFDSKEGFYKHLGI